MKRTIIMVVFAVVMTAGCSNDGPATGDIRIPSGTYAIDPSHTYITFYYLHQGFSYPLLRATSAAGELEFDAETIENSLVNVVIATDSIRSNIDYFDEELASRKFFNADKFPYITFSSDSYEAVSENDGIVYGQVTIRGISKSLQLIVKMNGAMIHPMAKKPVLGFSATGSLSRSDFGLDRGVPVVSDTVEFRIETEFLKGSNEDSQAAVRTVARGE